MRSFICLILIASILLIYGCGSDSQVSIKDVGVTGDYVVFAWNDLGMHCLNPTYDSAVILPPYNTVLAQVIKKGSPPQIVTKGIEVDYKILNNTYSYGKKGFGQFWDNCQKLFGINLAHDTGLNLEDPGIHNSLSGKMVSKGDHFTANGIPVTPIDDSGVWNPYQVAEITVKSDAGDTLIQTRTTVPTSDEINCSRCHGDNAFIDILQKHDDIQKTKLMNQKPILCASCHGTPALGANDKGSSGKYLSEAIHGSHASRGAACLDCHPGKTTKCNRSLRHTAEDGNCITCHGDMSKVSGSIKSGERTPWVNEPKCSSCHTNIVEVDTGTTLYRNAKGHGGLYCTSCHSSPHAMVPSREDSDNYQSIQYQNVAKSIGSCGACHSNSKGKGSENFTEAHVGSNPEHKNACYICHTSLTADTGKWPHAFQWKAR
jgi:hypothetical protein